MRLLHAPFLRGRRPGYRARMDPRLQKLASVLVRYSTGVRPGDLVVIGGPTAAAEFVTALYGEVLEAGGHPWVRLAPEACQDVHFRVASDEQLRYVSDLDREVIERADVRIAAWVEENTKRFSRVDPKKQALASQARAPLMERFLERASKPEGDPERVRWTGTVVPNHAAAQDAEMSLAEYGDFVYRAGKLDEHDPVAAWRMLGDAQKALADRLERASELHITTPQGTDIRFGIEGRQWINCDGHENFPDGEVFTGPIEDATEGVVRYSFPAVHGGREVADIELRFQEGRVVDASASRNEEFLHRMLDQDEGARCLGEVALGTNYSIEEYTRNTLFDEKIGGTFHAAVGAAYPESGGTNKSGLHWDMVCDLRQGGIVKVDGELLSENGRFVDPAFPQPKED